MALIGKVKPDSKDLVKVLKLINDLNLDEQREILDHISDAFDDSVVCISNPDISAEYYKALDCIDEGSLRLSRLLGSWNNSTAPAYNLNEISHNEVHNVVDNNLQGKVFEMLELETDDLHYEFGELISEFNCENDYKWQAGFNGRSGGYLVLYKGGKKSSHKSICDNCGQRNFTSVKETGNLCGNCGQDARVDRLLYDTFVLAGKAIADGDVPADVLKALWFAKNSEVTIHEYQVTKTHKVLQPIERRIK